MIEGHRRSIRLRDYDYAQAGAYFVTICSHQRECLFGTITGGVMQLSDTGAIVQAVWNGLPEHYANVELDAFVVMPNHVHAIVVLMGVRAGLKPAPTEPAPTEPAPTEPARTFDTTRQHGLPEIVRALKTFSARRINEMRGTVGLPVWQRNYYEHVVRDDRSLNRIREYIEDNPRQWSSDRENPEPIEAPLSLGREDELWRV